MAWSMGNREHGASAVAAAGGKTLVMPGMAQESPKGGCMGAMLTRAMQWVNVVWVIDRSWSVPADGLDHLVHQGMPYIFAKMDELGKAQGYRYNIAIVGVSTNAEDILPPSTLQQAIDFALPQIEPYGYTNLEEGLSRAHQIIDAWKADQDARCEKRLSSTVITLSDCMATGEDGYRRPLGNALVADIEHRMETGATNHFTIGYGDVDEGMMHLMGGGVRYCGGDFRDLDAWQQIAMLIARGSTNPRRGTDGVRYESDIQRLLEGDVIEVDPDVWEIVE